MSYKTPQESTVAFKDLEVKLQYLSQDVKSKLTWLSYAFGLTDRTVETKDNKPFIYPAVWQTKNSEDPLSMMPSDLYHAFCFWVKDEDIRFPDENFARAWVDVSCIFYCDLKNISPNTDYKLTKTKIRQDIIEAFRQNQYGGLGVLRHKSIIDDDITKIYDGYSIDQVDNKYKMLPKYALRYNFEIGFLLNCSSFNTYA